MLFVALCAKPLASNHTQDQIRSKIVIITVAMKAVLLCGTSCSWVNRYCHFGESYFLLIQDIKWSLRWMKWSREVGFTPPSPLSSCLLPEILLSILPLIFSWFIPIVFPIIVITNLYKIMQVKTQQLLLCSGNQVNDNMFRPLYLFQLGHNQVKP
jgi:hypothetical protein